MRTQKVLIRVISHVFLPVEATLARENLRLEMGKMQRSRQFVKALGNTIRISPTRRIELKSGAEVTSIPRAPGIQGH